MLSRGLGRALSRASRPLSAARPRMPLTVRAQSAAPANAPAEPFTAKGARARAGAPTPAIPGHAAR
jgi:hypothetical protein